ncbi:hypothetical protein LJK87_01610 [Paenibacillus sp. P25]|nr:hypothetical protein LJK87_01610 [Paenibacillus sp. P25]
MGTIRKWKRAGPLLVGLALLLTAPTVAYAVNPYWGYIYNTDKFDKPSLNGYLPLDSIDGYDMASGPFKGPEDLFVSRRRYDLHCGYGQQPDHSLRRDAAGYRHLWDL